MSSVVSATAGPPPSKQFQEQEGSGGLLWNVQRATEFWTRILGIYFAYKVTQVTHMRPSSSHPAVACPHTYISWMGTLLGSRSLSRPSLTCLVLLLVVRLWGLGRVISPT